MNKKHLIANILSPALQTLVNGGVLFVLYRYLLARLGPDEFGVWALVLSWCSTVGIANLGMTGSITKFVAQHLAHDRRQYASELIQTAVISLTVFLGAALLLCWPILSLILGNLLKSPGDLSAAKAILPYGMASLLINSIASLIQSAIDGHQRVALRSLSSTIGSLCYLFMAFLFVNRHGLIGLAQAQLLSSLAALAIAWVLLGRIRPELPWIPLSWTTRSFRELISYSLNFQLISFTYLLLEPTTKSLMAAFGSVGSIAYFEMANRLTMYARSLLINSHQALVGTISHMDVVNRDFNKRLYAFSFDFYLYCSILLVPLSLAIIPIVSAIWLGRIQMDFVVFASLLSIGWAANVLSSPAYFANLGTGHLRWNLISHIAVGAINLLLGFGLALAVGSLGAVTAFSAALVAGSLIMVLSYGDERALLLSRFAQPRTLVTLGCAVLGMTLAFASTMLLRDTMPASLTAAIALLVYAPVVFPQAWAHPVRSQIHRFLSERNSSK